MWLSPTRERLVQSPTPALLYVISDLGLYKELEALHRGGTFLPDQAFAFLGSTFGCDVPWDHEDMAALLPTSRLLLRWVRMNEMTERKIIPALRSGEYRAVFIHEYGREAYHFAIRFGACPQTLGFHTGLVQSRIFEQGGVPPTAYIARRPIDSYLVAADAAYCADGTQRIHHLEATTPEDEKKEMIAFLKADIPTQRQRQLYAVA